jgi:hypothetical protein
MIFSKQNYKYIFTVIIIAVIICIIVIIKHKDNTKKDDISTKKDDISTTNDNQSITGKTTPVTTDDLTKYVTKDDLKNANYASAEYMSNALSGVVQQGGLAGLWRLSADRIDAKTIGSNRDAGVAIGDAAADGTAGNFNVAIGQQALQNAGNSTSTVGIGYQAAYGAGSNSFGLGFASCFGSTSAGNICIGNSSGQFATTGGYNTYIGAGASPSSSAAKYEIVIGNSPAGIKGLGQSTAYISSSMGLFGGAFIPKVSGDTISPQNNSNGGFISLLNGMVLMWWKYPETVTFEAEQRVLITWNFPTQFNNNTLCSVIMSGNDADSITHSFYNLTGKSVTYSLRNNGTTTVGIPIFWAIGY